MSLPSQRFTLDVNPATLLQVDIFGNLWLDGVLIGHAFPEAADLLRKQRDTISRRRAAILRSRNPVVS